jgi:hypothetical protein
MTSRSESAAASLMADMFERKFALILIVSLNKEDELQRALFC